MNVKKNEKMSHMKRGLLNRLHGISFDVHTSSQTNVNGFGNVASQLVGEDARKLESATSLAIARCRMEADRLRFRMV